VTTPQDILLAAAADIEANGLWQYTNPSTTSGTCPLIAIGDQVVFGSAGEQEANEARTIFAKHLGTDLIAEWSDASSGKDEVVDALRRAATS
jgi:hypothetical protein